MLFFRKRGIKCIYYIDDSLIMNADYKLCQEHTETVESTLSALGYSVNYKKSALIPSQRVVFFGLIVDTVEFKVISLKRRLRKFHPLESSFCHQGR